MVSLLIGHWRDSRFFYDIWMGHPRIGNGTSGFEFLLPLMFLVRVRVLELNMRLWRMKDWVQLLENPHGSTHTRLREYQTWLTRRYTRQRGVLPQLRLAIEQAWLGSARLSSSWLVMVTSWLGSAHYQTELKGRLGSAHFPARAGSFGSRAGSKKQQSAIKVSHQLAK